VYTPILRAAESRAKLELKYVKIFPTIIGYLERELIPVNAESDDCRLQVIRLNSGFLKAELFRTPPLPKKRYFESQRIQFRADIPIKVIPFCDFSNFLVSN
jgi:hypothetical protein